MSRVGIRLDKGNIQLAPGETAEVRVSVTNLGDVVDAFTLSVVGLDPLWYALTQSEVRLFPEDSGDVILRVQPTQGYSSQAGSYPFTVVATSHDSTSDHAEVQVMLILASVGELAIGVTPERVRGHRGSFWITLQNPGNSPRHIVLALTDPEEGLSYTLGPAMQVDAAGGLPPSFPPPTSIKSPIAHGEGVIEHELELPPGSDLTLPVLVRPMHRIWTGAERTFQIGVRVHPPGVEWEPLSEKRAAMSLVYRPILAAWSGLPRVLRRALSLAIPLLILALLLFLLLKPGDGPTGPQLAASQTATTVALSVQQTGTALAASAAQTAQALSQTVTAVARANGGNQAAANATLTALSLSPVELSASQSATALALLAQADAGSPSIQKFYLVVASPTLSLANTPGGESTPTEGTPTAGAGTGNRDGQPDVTWDVTSAKAIRIDQRAHAFDSPDTSLSVVDYTMVATGTHRVTTDTISILVVRPPQIEAFTADPSVIPAGESTTLSFVIHGTGTCSMDGASMPIPADGKGSVVATPPGTHIYVHCAENAAGRNCRAVKVTVLTPDTPTPAATLPPVVVPPTATNAPPPPLPSATAVPHATSTRVPTATRKPTIIAKPSVTSVLPTSTRIPTRTPQPPATPTLSATRIPTRTAQASATLPPSPTNTHTSTTTPTSTSTATRTPTGTATNTATNTATDTHTSTSTRTATPTRTSASTSTRTRTPIRTVTRTETPTCAPSYVITRDTAPANGVTTRRDTGNHCDDCTTVITLPFTIHLYDQDFTSALVGSNGTISFTNSNAFPDNECLPTSRLEFVIFPYWDDLDTRTTQAYSRAGIFTEFISSPNGSTFSIEWDAVNKAFQKPVSFVLHFYENSTRFDVVYLQDDGSGGSSATIGVEEAFDPSSGVGHYTQFSCNQSGVGVRTRLRFIYSQCQSPTVIPIGVPGEGPSSP